VVIAWWCSTGAGGLLTGRRKGYGGVENLMVRRFSSRSSRTRVFVMIAVILNTQTPNLSLLEVIICLYSLCTLLVQFTHEYFLVVVV